MHGPSNLLGSAHWMMASEDEMCSICNLHHVRLVLYVDSPNLARGAAVMIVALDMSIIGAI